MSLYIYDNTTVKWKEDDRLYCLHIQVDDDPMNPRRDMGDSLITTMACWHRRYDLGDRIHDKEPEDFWRRLVRENVSDEEIVAAAEGGKLGVRVAECEGKPGFVNIYETLQWRTVLGDSAPKESLVYEELRKTDIASYILDDLTISECMTLMAPHAAWLPLWLYDHSGITMSCGRRRYPYDDPWDSGQVGWIVALKKDIMRELVEYVLDENGERIKDEHPHDNMPSTWSYRTRTLTDETWEKRAVEYMEAEVKEYDQYLTGDIYGYTLYSAPVPDNEDEAPDWTEEDSCWGFWGNDLLENGIVDAVGDGFAKALETGEYDVGEAEVCRSTYYSF